MHVNKQRKRTPNGARTATGVHEEKHVSSGYGMQTLASEGNGVNSLASPGNDTRRARRPSPKPFHQMGSIWSADSNGIIIATSLHFCVQSIVSSQNLGKIVNVPWHQTGSTFVGAGLWLGLNDRL